MPGVLEGVKILDLTRLLPGPYGTMLLGDMGAEIVKIEDARAMDMTRMMPPAKKDMSAFFAHLNRNKRSIKLNLKKPEGVEILKKLAAEYDVLIEQFRPGVMDRLGVGYEDIKKVNPSIIYCAITGYGQDGPYRDRAGHDLNYLAIAGVLGLSGDKNGEPTFPGVQAADLAGGGMFAAMGILGAVIKKLNTGKGQYVDISMTDSMFSWVSIHSVRYLMDDRIPVGRRQMELNGRLINYDIYKTRDGKYMTIGALEPKFWDAFCKAVDRKDLIPKNFSVGEERIKYGKEMEEIIGSKTRDEWVKFIEETGLDACFEPVLEVPEALEHPQNKARGLVREYDHPHVGKIPQIMTPIKYSDDPVDIFIGAPRAGEHTDEILKEVGYSDEEISRLKEAKVV